MHPPAVAGSFYSGDPAALQSELQQMLEGVSSSENCRHGELKALIVPHAGYIYSGPTAAFAYECLRQHAARFSRVVLFGPAHRYPVDRLVTHSADYFSTPLGSIPINRELRATLCARHYLTEFDPAFEMEHSIEVQLPFLQAVLDDFSIVPVIAGQDNSDEISQILQMLWDEDDVLFVISTDLSHFHHYDIARQMDHQTIDATLHLDYEALDFDHACGRVPLTGVIKACRSLGGEIKLLDARNSGDTAGDKERVVGYASFIVTRNPVQESITDPTL